MTDDLEQLPPIAVEPSSAPFELPATHKTCPDCEREVPAPGITYPRDPLRPLSEFYEQKAKRYENGKRYSAYCKPHQRQRNKAAYAAKADDPEWRARRRKSNAKSAKATEKREARRAQWRRASQAWRKRNRELNSARASDWVKKNKKRHAASALRSYHRRRGQRPPDES